MSCTINEFTKVYIRDFYVQDSRETEKLREILRHYDGQVKINLYTDNSDNGKRLKSYNTQGGVGVYVSNNTIYFRFTSVFKFTDNLKYSLFLTNVFYDKTEPLIIDLFTENDLFDYLNILYDSRYMEIKRNPCTNITYNKSNDEIGYKYTYEIDNDNIYKSKKLYKYHIPLSKEQYNTIIGSHVSLLSCNFIDDSDIRININLEDIFKTRGHNILANYIHLYVTKDNTEMYLILYSNKKVKHPEEIKITNVNRTNHVVSINIENVDMFDEFFFWDKTFENKEIETVIDYTPLLLIEPKDVVNIDLIQKNYINLVPSNTSIKIDDMISLIKESDVVFLKYRDRDFENFIELKLDKNLIIENDKINIKAHKEYKGHLDILNYKFNKNGFKSLFIESVYNNDNENEDTLSLVQLPDSQYGFVKIGEVPKEVINLYLYSPVKTINIDLYTPCSLYEYRDYNVINHYLGNLYLVYKKNPNQDKAPEINFANYKYDENNKLSLILYLKSKSFDENIKNIFTDTVYSTFLGGKSESYIKLPLDKESKDEILNKILNNEKVGIEISFLKRHCTCLSDLILNKGAFVSNNEIYIKILSKRDNIIGNQVELKYLPNFGINNSNIKFSSNILSWTDFRIQRIDEDIKELQLADLYYMIFDEKYNLMLDKISSGCKYKVRFLSKNNSVLCAEEYIINDKNCSIKNNTLYIKLICNLKDPNELINPVIKNIDNDNHIIEVETPLQDFQYIYILDTGYSNDNDEIKNNKVISWDEYFMGVAELSAKRSKDPNRQVGACITKNNVIVGTGYNGFPRGCSDEDFPWTKDSNEITETKFAYVVHAELNAILNSTRRNLNDAVIYVTLFPCTECTKAIIQSGIKKVIYKDPGKHEKEINASLKMFKSSGVEVIKYK